jgi:formate hydrogenlyase subunit 6/NADH:ubiquinone oxidoreductase subunit I
MSYPGKMLSEVLSASVQKPATVQYPFVKVVMPPKFRGRLLFHAERCIGCRLCMKDCPANAIEIREVAKKRFEALIHLDRCIYCAQCTDSCNKDALEATPEFELAAFRHDQMKLHFDAPPPIAEANPQPTP